VPKIISERCELVHIVLKIWHWWYRCDC